MILLTVDTSDESTAAFETAVTLAVRFELPLHLLLVLDGPLRHHFNELSRTRDASIEATVDAHLAEATERVRALGAPEVAASFRHGANAGDAIVTAATDDDATLLVMATHGRSGLSRFITGSVTEHVIRHSPIPVVVVPVRTSH